MCNYDFLEIRDGPIADSDWTRLCGGVQPSPISSSGNELELVFKSDTSVSKGELLYNYTEEIL